MSHQYYDIVIVGAGLVGLTLAARIATRSENQTLSILLIDQAASPAPLDTTSSEPIFDSRVVALTHASINLLTKIGAWQTIQSQRACAYRHMSVWDDEGTGYIDFHAEQLAQKELGFIVENQLLISAILAVIAPCESVNILRECSVEQIKSGNNCKHLTLTTGEIIETSLVVAADGGESHMRQLSGLPIRRWEYQQKAIVTTVKCEHSHQETAWQNFLSSGPLAFLPLDHPSQRYCSIVWSIDSILAEELMALADDAFIDRLSQAFEYKLGRVESITKRFCFPLIQRHAIEYIAPQFALIGDAAHTIHPLAGQGVNLGLLDVSVLADEITRASVRQLPIADFSILRRYQRQRKGHNLQTMLLMESFKRLFGEKNLFARWLRNTGMRKINKVQLIKNWLAKQGT